MSLPFIYKEIEHTGKISFNILKPEKGDFMNIKNHGYDYLNLKKKSKSGQTRTSTIIKLEGKTKSELKI